MTQLPSQSRPEIYMNLRSGPCVKKVVKKRKYTKKVKLQPLTYYKAYRYRFDKCFKHFPLGLEAVLDRHHICFVDRNMKCNRYFISKSYCDDIEHNNYITWDPNGKIFIGCINPAHPMSKWKQEYEPDQMI